MKTKVAVCLGLVSLLVSSCVSGPEMETNEQPLSLEPGALCFNASIGYADNLLMIGNYWLSWNPTICMPHGTVSRIEVKPPLPQELSLNSTSGRISGYAPSSGTMAVYAEETLEFEEELENPLHPCNHAGDLFNQACNAARRTVVLIDVCSDRRVSMRYRDSISGAYYTVTTMLRCDYTPSTRLGATSYSSVRLTTPNPHQRYVQPSLPYVNQTPTMTGGYPPFFYQVYQYGEYQPSPGGSRYVTLSGENITLDSQTGKITGYPTRNNSTHSFTVRITDARGQVIYKSLSLAKRNLDATGYGQCVAYDQDRRVAGTLVALFPRIVGGVGNRYFANIDGRIARSGGFGPYTYSWYWKTEDNCGVNINLNRNTGQITARFEYAVLANVANQPGCEQYHPTRGAVRKNVIVEDSTGASVRYPVTIKFESLGSQDLTNGCGGDDTDWIPDGDFTGACNTHDVCYSTCNANKNSCDADFTGDLFSACRREYAWYNPVRVACYAWATLYSAGVFIGGYSAYIDAQNNCVNLDDPNEIPAVTIQCPSGVVFPDTISGVIEGN